MLTSCWGHRWVSVPAYHRLQSTHQSIMMRSPGTCDATLHAALFTQVHTEDTMRPVKRAVDSVSKQPHWCSRNMRRNSTRSPFHAGSHRRHDEASQARRGQRIQAATLVLPDEARLVRSAVETLRSQCPVDRRDLPPPHEQRGSNLAAEALPNQQATVMEMLFANKLTSFVRSCESHLRMAGSVTYLVNKSPPPLAHGLRTAAEVALRSAVRRKGSAGSRTSACVSAP